MIDNLSLFFKKYFVPTVFVVVGIVIIGLGIAKDQGGIFMFSAVLMFGAGAISILYSLGKLKPLLVYIIGGVMGLIAVFTLYMSWDSVATTQQYNESSKKCQLKAKQNLTDISYIQKSYKEKNGVYLKNWESLIEYAKTGTVPEYVSEGVVPSVRLNVEERDYLYGDDRALDKNMTEEEAYRLSLWKQGPRYNQYFSNFVRDTNQVSLLKSKFETRSYREARIKEELGNFYVDSLPFIPYTNGKDIWKMEAKDSIFFNDMTGPSIFIYGTLPYAKEEGSARKIVMTLGKLTTFEHTGSWETE
ncbi:MAG: hypothetical protein ACJA0U_002419 [Salibacteraceae bacterium]|jgi:hypothetical protein